MIRKLFFLLVIVASSCIAQERQVVFKGRVHATYNDPFVLNVSFAKGDVVYFSFNAAKELEMARVGTYDGKSMFFRENIDYFDTGSFYVGYDNVFFFTMQGKKLFGDRMVDLLIERIPASEATKFFNPASNFTAINEQDTFRVNRDTLTGYEIQDKAYAIKMFDSYIYQEIPVRKEKLFLYGALTVPCTKYYDFQIPKPPVENAKLKYWTFVATSRIGGEKHWEIAKVGASIATSFINPAAGVATSYYMDFLGPQPGGEPAWVYLTTYKEDADFLVKSIGGTAQKTKKVFSDLFTGLVNGKSAEQVMKDELKGLQYDFKNVYQKNKVTNIYGVVNTIIGDGRSNYIVIGNPDLHKAKNANFEISAIYYAPYFKNVTVYEKTFVPKIEQVRENKIVLRTNYVPVPIQKSEF